jgi:hypothetical protein
MVSLNIPPLMHGAAQWGALRFLFEGGTVVFVPQVQSPRRSGRHRGPRG